MYIHIYIYIYICTHTYIHTYIHIRTLTPREHFALDLLDVEGEELILSV